MKTTEILNEISDQGVRRAAQTMFDKILTEDGELLGGGGSASDNISTVADDETIQSTIDACPVAVGNLKEGFTNPQIVNVPPGHEKEYYSLVLDGDDAASDKRNVKVVFEDNPDGEFKIDSWDNCDSLTGWAATYGTAELEEDHRVEGEHCFHIYNAGHLGIEKTFAAEDLSMYQGLLVHFEFKTAEILKINCLVKDADGGQSLIAYDVGGNSYPTDNFKRSMYLPLYDFLSTSSHDITQTVSLEFHIIRNSGSTATIDGYIDNIRLIRTIPCSTALLRFDDSFAAHFSIVAKEFSNRGWKGLFCLTRMHHILDETTNYMTLDEAKKLRRLGHEMGNHTIDQTLFDESKSKHNAVYQILGANKFLDQYGLSGNNIFYAAPAFSMNDEVLDVVEKAGVWGLDPPQGIYPTAYDICFDSAFAITDKMQTFIDSKRGGIFQFIFHDVTNEANFTICLDWIEANFSEIILPSSIANRFPIEYQRASNKDAKIPFGYKATLTDNFRLYNYMGSQVILDPGGAGRTVTPCFAFDSFHTINLINSADNAETLTFDPTFTSAGAHDGAVNAATLTDSGESWTIGQLVGRTVSNTTDVSSGVITANTATTVTAILSGGTDNDWDVADNYTITPVGLNEAVAQAHRGQFVYDGEGWLKIFVG